MGWGNERLVRLGEAAWCLLLTGAQQRGSPGTPAREVVAIGSTGHSRLLKEGGCRATWVTACLFRVLPLGCRKGYLASLGAPLSLRGLGKSGSICGYSRPRLDRMGFIPHCCLLPGQV